MPNQTPLTSRHCRSLYDEIVKEATKAFTMDIVAALDVPSVAYFVNVRSDAASNELDLGPAVLSSNHRRCIK
jgi:hypothetical protein